jgi:hypothetical protein
VIAYLFSFSLEFSFFETCPASPPRPCSINIITTNKHSQISDISNRKKSISENSNYLFAISFFEKTIKEGNSI